MENILIICVECGKETTKPKGEVNRSNKVGRKMFCTLSCGAKYQQKIRGDKLRENYKLNPKLCKHCNTPIDFELKGTNMYCSQSCSATVSNTNRKKEVLCLNCNSEIIGRKRPYCSIKCSAESDRKDTLYRIENGGTVHIQYIRKYLIEKFGEKCMICGWDKKNPITNKSPLDLDHIDGDSKNNKLENLRIICPNCHSLTPTYKALNRGKGREERRKIYQSGVSTLELTKEDNIIELKLD